MTIKSSNRDKIPDRIHNIWAVFHHNKTCPVCREPINATKNWEQILSEEYSTIKVKGRMGWPHYGLWGT